MAPGVGSGIKHRCATTGNCSTKDNISIKLYIGPPIPGEVKPRVSKDGWIREWDTSLERALEIMPSAGDSLYGDIASALRHEAG